MSRMLSLLSSVIERLVGAVDPVEISGDLGLSGDEIVGQLFERG